MRNELLELLLGRGLDECLVLDQAEFEQQIVGSRPRDFFLGFFLDVFQAFLSLIDCFLLFRWHFMLLLAEVILDVAVGNTDVFSLELDIAKQEEGVGNDDEGVPSEVIEAEQHQEVVNALNGVQEFLDFVSENRMSRGVQEKQRIQGALLRNFVLVDSRGASLHHGPDQMRQDERVRKQQSKLDVDYRFRILLPITPPELE